MDTEKLSLNELIIEFELIKNKPKNPNKNNTMDIMITIDMYDVINLLFLILFICFNYY
jgi:hypothetical protein